MSALSVSMPLIRPQALGEDYGETQNEIEALLREWEAISGQQAVGSEEWEVASMQ